MSDDREELVAEVNRLYWESDQPVTELAERLGISRRTIYDMIEPLPVDEPCPECGGPLTYTSRSARMSGEALCELCGKSQDITLLRELAEAARASTAVATRPQRVPEYVRPVPRRPSPAFTLVLAGALAATVLAVLLRPHPRPRPARRVDRLWQLLGRRSPFRSAPWSG